MSNKLLVLALVCFMVGTGCTTPGAHRVLQQKPQAPNSGPKLLAVYMPWFGDHVHIDVGYDSYNPEVLRRQIQQARHLGITGFVVDWYGQSQPFSDHNFQFGYHANDNLAVTFKEIQQPIFPVGQLGIVFPQ